MLDQFTWTDFFTGTALACLAWYCWLGVTWSGGRRGHGFSAAPGGLGSGGGGRAAGSDGADAGPGTAGDPPEVMGRAKLAEGVLSISPTELSFAPLTGGSAGADEPGLRDELLADIRDIFKILAKEDGSKQDFFRLIASVRESYPGIAGHPGLAQVNAYISSAAPFLISAKELEGLWD